ncbi:MAG TPA: hypothetical protein VEY06_06265 [Flavisolibacter sp.]|jgi:hypothetical protein|nr:hypothetical protein [Flavisolibacter sp.]
MKCTLLIALACASCTPVIRLQTNKPGAQITGSEFYKQAASFNWQQRDSFAVKVILDGNVPRFLKRLIPVHTETKTGDSKIIKGTYYVTPDYLGIGTNRDWARIPLTPMAAQKIADSMNCFLPTRKMADEVYARARVKLEPVPMYAFRDSTATFYQHHVIIEGQRKGRTGLIAGVKKDVVISGKVSRDPKQNRVAIYGWHKPDGTAIQKLYTGHINWYVDYSHGIRLVYQKIKVAGKWMNYTQVLNDPVLKKLLCDEEHCDFHRYAY